MLSAVEMVVRHGLGQKGSQIGFWSRLEIISCWDCGSAGPDWAKLQTSWNSSWVPFSGFWQTCPSPRRWSLSKDPNLSLSLCTHPPGVFVLHPFCPRQEDHDHIWLSVLVTIVTSHHPRLWLRRTLWVRFSYYSHFTEEETVTSKGQVICPRSHNWYEADLRLGLRNWDQSSMCLSPMEDQSLWGAGDGTGAGVRWRSLGCPGQAVSQDSSVSWTKCCNKFLLKSEYLVHLLYQIELTKSYIIHPFFVSSDHFGSLKWHNVFNHSMCIITAWTQTTQL